MNINDLIQKWKQFVDDMNDKGVPLPIIRVDGKASLSATLVWISFNTWMVSVVGKWAGALGGVDSNQCLQMFLACAGLYWGRKLTSNKDGTVSVEEKNGNEEK
jgi:hypothetical protein